MPGFDGGSIVLLRPKPPLLAWVQGLPEELVGDVPQTLAELSAEMAGFWLPGDDGPVQALKQAQRQWLEMWESELNQWDDGLQVVAAPAAQALR